MKVLNAINMNNDDMNEYLHWSLIHKDELGELLNELNSVESPPFSREPLSRI
jgi:hypothetical protein